MNILFPAHELNNSVNLSLIIVFVALLFNLVKIQESEALLNSFFAPKLQAEKPKYVVTTRKTIHI
jgi:hypothetical protein